MPLEIISLKEKDLQYCCQTQALRRAPDRPSIPLKELPLVAPAPSDPKKYASTHARQGVQRRPQKRIPEDKVPGPFPGDLVSFKLRASATPTNVKWTRNCGFSPCVREQNLDACDHQ